VCIDSAWHTSLRMGSGRDKKPSGGPIRQPGVLRIRSPWLCVPLAGGVPFRRATVTALAAKLAVFDGRSRPTSRRVDTFRGGRAEVEPRISRVSLVPVANAEDRRPCTGKVSCLHQIIYTTSDVTLPAVRLEASNRARNANRISAPVSIDPPHTLLDTIWRQWEIKVNNRLVSALKI
jgi:hypothetical protein